MKTQICPRNPKYCYSTQHPGPLYPCSAKGMHGAGSETLTGALMPDKQQEHLVAGSLPRVLSPQQLLRQPERQNYRNMRLAAAEQRGWGGLCHAAQGLSLTRLQCIRVGSGTPVTWSQVAHSGTGISGGSR